MSFNTCMRMNRLSSSFWKNFSRKILNASADAKGVPVKGSLYLAFVLVTGQIRGTGPYADADPGTTGLRFYGSNCCSFGKAVFTTK